MIDIFSMQNLELVHYCLIGVKFLNCMLIGQVDENETDKEEEEDQGSGQPPATRRSGELWCGGLVLRYATQQAMHGQSGD